MPEKCSNRLLYCYNCFESSHIAHNCPKPVNSYGIICYKISQLGDIKYLFVQRRFSYSFVDFMTGKYSLTNYKYIQKMFNKMTLFERCLIKNNDFKELWAKVFGSIFIYKKSVNRIFYKGSIKFYILRDSFKYGKRTFKTDTFINNSCDNYKTPEWYFPKGRKNNNEKKLDCAIREFMEETNMQEDNFQVICNYNTLSETHISMNNKIYCAEFYIAEFLDNHEYTFLEKNNYQRQEIGNIEWLTYNEAKKKFRIYEVEKFALLDELHYFLKGKLQDVT